MSIWLLYLLLLKSSLGSFSGLASLPIIREDFVVNRHVLTDRDLNTAVVIGRSTPGPKGLYVVSVGYYAGGFPGAVAAWFALVTPALLVIPLLEFAGRRANHPKVKQVLKAVVLGSAGISLSATLPLASDAINGAVSVLIAAGALAVLAFTEIDTIWVIMAGSLLGLAASALGLFSAA